MQFDGTAWCQSVSSSTQTSKRMSNYSISESSTLHMLRGLFSTTFGSVLSQHRRLKMAYPMDAKADCSPDAVKKRLS